MSQAGPGRPHGRFTQHHRFELLRELLTRHPRGLTLYEIAERLDVSTRTVRRYLKEVEHEFDLECVTPRDGGPQLWKVPASELPRKVALRRTQAYAMLAARRLFEPMRGSALFDEIDMAITRMMGIAQRPGRGPNAGVADARLEERFLYLPYAPKNYAQKTEELDDLFQAVADLRPLTLMYRSLARPVEERITVHPYAMVLHRDSVYCVGYHVERGAIRTLVLDRMRNTQFATSERFELPADFHIDDYFQGEFGIWKGGKRTKVVVDFDAHAAPYVRMRKVHGTQRLSSLAGGGVRLSMSVGNLTPVTSWVLEWGQRARVVEPPELVERVKAELAAALQAYSGPRKSRGRAGSQRRRTDRADR
jgi:predicted DNA-binding transcriptional regulator YafY